MDTSSSSEDISIIEKSLNEAPTISLAPLKIGGKLIPKSIVCIDSSSDDEPQTEKLKLPLSRKKPSKRLNRSDISYTDSSCSSTPLPISKKIDDRNSALKARQNILCSTRIDDGEVSTPRSREFSKLFKQYEEEEENSDSEATQQFKNVMSKSKPRRTVLVLNSDDTEDEVVPSFNSQKSPPLKNVDDSDSDSEIIRPRPTPGKNRRFALDSDSSSERITGSEKEDKFSLSASFKSCTMMGSDKDRSDSDDAERSSKKLIEQITPKINPQKSPPVKETSSSSTDDDDSGSDSEIIRPRPLHAGESRKFVSDSDSSSEKSTDSENEDKLSQSASFGGCTMVHDDDLGDSDDSEPSPIKNIKIEPNVFQNTDEVICIEDSDQESIVIGDDHKLDENKENTRKTPRKNKKMLANRKENILDNSYFINKINYSSPKRIIELKKELERSLLEQAELKTKETSIIESLNSGKIAGSLKKSLEATSRDLKHVKMRIETIQSTLKKHPEDLKKDQEVKIIDLTKTDDKKSHPLGQQSSKAVFPKPLQRIEPIYPPVLEPWNLENPDIKLSDLGKKALESHNAQRALTDEGIKAIHESLETYPNLQELDDDPEGIKVNLLPHQKKALKWLVWRETQNPSGGVLADDMGLGKTLTILSLVLHQKNAKIRRDESVNPSVPCGETLVICPSSVMGQWEGEIKSRFKGGSLSYLVYHGNKRERNPKRIARFDVVITTYALIQKQSDDGPLLSIMWNRVILDEAHMIRNHQTQTAQSVFKLRRQNSWALTGTPIHNKEMDYYSLIKFIKCKPFNDLTIWKKWVSNKNAAGLHRLNLITNAIMLRRTKKDLNSAGSLDMQTKELTIVRVKLDHQEYEVYEKIAQFSKAVLANFIQQRAEKEDLLNKGVPARDIAKNLMSLNHEENPFRNHPDLARLHKNMMTMGDRVKSHEILMLLLRLRQICCHPCLAVSILEKEEAMNDGIDEINTDLADKLINLSICENPNDGRDKLSVDNPVFHEKRISSKIKSVIECIMDIINDTETDKLIVVSQWTSMLTLIEKVLDDHGLSTVSLTGKVLVKDRMPIVENFNAAGKSPRILLLSLTAGGTGLNLIGGNHLLLVDIHWNPQLEAQACDRIYRVGQKKPVHIYKFICTDTIEERIEQLQMKKLEIANDVLTGSMKVQTKLSLMDLKQLFGL